ncbi:MAG: putative DNA binding domain-containing protein [Eubacteriales bacterium]|nr:putative DNA binding domain-containing protein [Eubacteriales bacterium]
MAVIVYIIIEVFFMKKYLESDVMELKEKYSDTIAKEIVSFLNSEGGTIIIGVKDNGTVTGVEKLDETLRKISDIITMQVEPNPQDEVSTEVKFEKQKPLILINVSKGSKSIYCQKKYGFSSGGCTIRVGTACKEMTPEQIRIRYEQNFIDSEYMLKKRSSLSELSFRELKIYYTEKGFHVNDSFETNLNLRNDKGEYNLLAELLADKNNIPFIFVKFQGSNKASISERNDFGYGCLLTTYTKIKNKLVAENTCLSNTTVRPRVDKYLYDIDCVDEALLNSIVHNDWTITEPQISMFYNRIEILSHGGLPRGMTKKQFFEGISKPRNATLMRIFLSMNLVEHTGHGVPTIVNKYGEDSFEIEENYIKCTIPFDIEVMEYRLQNGGIVQDGGLSGGNNGGLKPSDKKVLSHILIFPDDTAAQIAEKCGIGKRTVERSLAFLQEKGMIERIGNKRNGRWIVIK